MNNMLLAADIGNTSITIGIFNNDELLKVFRISSKYTHKDDYIKYLNEYTENFSIKDCVIASVADETTPIFKSACEHCFELDPFIITPQINLDMELKTEEPLSIGADRLANAYIARKYGLPAIVVDAGTAITLDIVSKDGDFIGGAIIPGLNMALNSLETCTSKLPYIKPDESPFAIGNTTETCILSGVIRGSACAIEGLIPQCENELGEKATIIGTGGQFELVSKYISRPFDYVIPNLTLEGIKAIYNYQLTHSSL